jgi:uncharacterized delta-60 repeat protein
MRFTSAGVLDTTFGNDGYAPWPFADLANAHAALQLSAASNGDILIAGSYNGEFVVVRYTADGQIDTTFGNDGMAVVSVGTNSSAQAMGIDSSGNIILVGYANMGTATNSNNDYAVVKLNANGSVDDSFGNNGIFTLDIDSGSDDQAQAMTINGDQIVIGGNSNNQFCLIEISDA